MAVRRTGLSKIRDLAVAMCKAIGVFTPIIKKVYPDATNLHLALDTANAACGLLAEEAVSILPEGD